MPTASEFAAKILVGDADLDRLNNAVNDAPGTFTTDEGVVVDNLRKRLAQITTQTLNGVATLNDLTSDTYLHYTGDANGLVAEGDLVQVGASLYEVAASDATDNHTVTTGGVKFYEAGPHFSTRARAVAWVARRAAAGDTIADGYLIGWGDLSVVASSGATDISDLLGFVPAGEIDVRHFGAIGDGVTVDSPAIDAAIAYRKTITGSTKVVFQAGVYLLSSAVEAYSDTEYVFEGIPTLKLNTNANSNVIESTNFVSAGSGGFTDSGLASENITFTGKVIVDGNRDNNTSPGTHEGHGVALFARDFTLYDIYAKDAYRSGLVTRYVSVGTSPYNGRFDHLTVDECGEHGWVNSVNDLQFGIINIASCGQNANNTYDGVYAISGARGANLTVWRKGFSPNTHRFAIYAEGGYFRCPAVALETAETALLRIQGTNCDIGGRIYNLIGSGANHMVVSGNMHRINVEITQGSLGVTDANLVQISGASRCDIDVRTSTNFASILDFPVASEGANNINVLYRGDDTSDIFKSGSNDPGLTDSVKFVQSSSTSPNARTYEKVAGPQGSIAAAGNSQGTAASFPYALGRSFPADASNQGVQLPEAIEGLTVHIQNTSSGLPLLVYPQSGENFYGLASDAAFSVSADSAAIFFCPLAGSWSAVGG